MDLHPVPAGPRERVWCGPAAVCIITGCSLQEAKEGYYVVRGVRRVARVHLSETREVLRRKGYLLVPEYQSHAGRTFAAWLREREPEDVNDLHLVRLTGHYVVVKGRRMVDNHTRVPVFIRRAPHRRRRVRDVFRVVEIVG